MRKILEIMHAFYPQFNNCMRNGLYEYSTNSLNINRRVWEASLYFNHFMKNLQQSIRNYGEEFTVLSYNVLAQDLINNNMYLYTFSEKQFLDWEYRKASLLYEIYHLNSDILCLQEIQDKHYHEFYEPELRKYGYRGIFKKRTHDKTDGCATFYRDSMFELEYSKSIEYFRPNCSSLLDRDNVALLLTLKFKGASKNTSKNTGNAMRICIANTHLLFNPKRTDVKIAQCHLLFAEIDKMTQIQQSFHGGEKISRIPFILCGDFNVEPFNQLYRRFLKPVDAFHLKYSLGSLKEQYPYGAIRAKDFSKYRCTPNVPATLKYGNNSLSSTSLLIPPWEMRNMCQNLQTDYQSRYLDTTRNNEKNAKISSSQVPISAELCHTYQLGSVYDNNLSMLIGINNSNGGYSMRSNTTLLQTISHAQSYPNFQEQSFNHRKTSLQTYMQSLPNHPVTTMNSQSALAVDYILYSLDSQIISAEADTFKQCKKYDKNNFVPSISPPNKKQKSSNTYNLDHSCKISSEPSNYKGQLKLLSRLKLPTAIELFTQRGGPLPNAHLSSDHICLMAKFLIHN